MRILCHMVYMAYGTYDEAMRRLRFIIAEEEEQGTTATNFGKLSVSGIRTVNTEISDGIHSV